MRKTYFYPDPNQSIELPDAFKDDDVRFPDSMVEYFLEEFTKPGDIVFDPFAGYGTTLLVAEKMGRIGYGIEIDVERWRFAQSTLKHPERLLLGDTRKLSTYDLPNLDFSITSPPYRTKVHKLDPLSGYKDEGGAYAEYIHSLQEIYAQVADLMKPHAHAVIKVSNLKTDDGVTTLAWDIGQAIAQFLTFEGERIVCWERFKSGYHHSYALIYSKSD
jgi:DNA modification methylase